MELGAAALIGMGLCAAGFAGAAIGIGYIFAQTIETVGCLLYTSPSPRDLSTSRMPSSA